MSAWQFLAALPLPMWGRCPSERSCPVITVADPAPRRKRRGKAPEPTPKQTGRKAEGIKILMARGYITQEDYRLMGDNSPGKTISRLRLDGLLNPDANDPSGYRDVPNRDGKGTHRRYLWTRHRPAGWPEPERMEQRGRYRGGWL